MDSTQTWWRQVGEGIRLILLRQRREVGELAAQLGRSRNYVSARLNGHDSFKLDEIETAARWLGVEVSDLAAEANR